MKGIKRKQENLTSMDDMDKNVPAEASGAEITKNTEAKAVRELFDAADELKRLEPWKDFCEIDICEIYLRDSSEPYYCSISGMFEERYSLSVYKGQPGLISLSAFLNAVDLPEYVALSRKNCLECSWGSRKDETSHDLAMVKAAGKKYRGNTAWPRFRLYETGYEPYYLNTAQQQELAEVMEALCVSIKEMQEDGIYQSLNEGERIRRRYDETEGRWINEIMPGIEKIEAMTDGCVITDELLVRRIMKKPVNGSFLEFDLPYIPVPLDTGEKGKRRIYPRLCILCDAERASMENQYFLHMYENYRDVALGMLLNYMEEKGRPTAVYVRDAELFGIISDLCSKVGVELCFAQMLKILDFFVDDVIEQFQ